MIGIISGLGAYGSAIFRVTRVDWICAGLFCWTTASPSIFARTCTWLSPMLRFTNPVVWAPTLLMMTWSIYVTFTALRCTVSRRHIRAVFTLLRIVLRINLGPFLRTVQNARTFVCKCIRDFIWKSFAIDDVQRMIEYVFAKIESFCAKSRTAFGAAFDEPVQRRSTRTPPQTDPSHVDSHNRYRRQQSRRVGKSAKSFRRWASKGQLEEYRRLKKGRLLRLWDGHRGRRRPIRNLFDRFIPFAHQVSVAVTNNSVMGALFVELIPYVATAASRVWPYVTDYWFFMALAFLFQVVQATSIGLLVIYGEEELFFWLTKKRVIYVKPDSGEATFVPPFDRPFVDELHRRFEKGRRHFILCVVEWYLSWYFSGTRAMIAETHWALAMLCARLNPVSFGVTFMSLSVLIDQHSRLLRSRVKGSRRVNWLLLNAILLVLVAGVEGVDGAQGVSAGNVVGGSAAVASVARIGKLEGRGCLKDRSARVFESPTRGK